MKKKILIAAAILALGITMAGCGSQSLKDYMSMSREGSMSISQAELTKQETQMKSLIQGDAGIAIFNYNADREVRTVSIACYKLNEKGEWEINSGWDTFPVEHAAGRIAVTFNNLGNGLRAAVQSGDSINAGENSITSNSADGNTGGMGISYASTGKIEYEKEIPIAMQVFTTESEINAFDVSFFNDPKELESRGYRDVYVVVVKFSKDEIQ